MSEFFKAELKDRFLQYACERDDYFETQLLYDEFLRPHYSLGYVEKLIQEIVDHDNQLLDIMSGNGLKIFMVSSTAATKEFIEEEGFCKLFVQEEEKWDIFLEQLSLSKKPSKQSFISSKNEKNAILKREKKLRYALMGVLAFCFLFSLFSLGKMIFGEDDLVTREELQKQLSKYKKEDTQQENNLDALINLEDPLEKDTVLLKNLDKR